MPDSAQLPVVRPIVVEGRVVALRSHRIEDSPLYGRTRLTGRIVTDPEEVAEIGACVSYGKRPWIIRLLTPTPKGWRQ
ncbi:hypothetical protein Ae717Ps2_6103c [Pseudonocardia sp. Ae717_Ps2]|nr:hypothetical protein Ae717Ps2_6103c [Pseudonocardia sp. Ae717_Ps2]